MKTAWLVGATGLIGSDLLKLLSEDSYYERVVVITRKGMEVPEKCENVIVNFDRLEDYLEDIAVDDVFCCLGTTIRVAKSKEAFRKVDFEYPLSLAKIAKRKGASNYLLVSALGANSNSSVFYNRVKGEIENAIAQLGYTGFHVFRPSLLLGKRKEYRSGEEAAKVFFKWFGFLVPARYKAIESNKVAKAMLHFARQNARGLFTHESHELQSF
jgi:uncharacterized protein YbjT (DUF2867 family)